jgi:hypothetical protein
MKPNKNSTKNPTIQHKLPKNARHCKKKVKKEYGNSFSNFMKQQVKEDESCRLFEAKHRSAINNHCMHHLLFCNIFLILSFHYRPSSMKSTLCTFYFCIIFSFSICTHHVKLQPNLYAHSSIL